MERLSSALDRYPDWEVVIGIEVHVQLTTNTKIFCACPTSANQEPNTNICIICSGYPGVLPVLNKKVVEYAIAAGIATNCTISPRSTFDRKHYFYPDLPKGYQITQQFNPICLEGYIPIINEYGKKKNIRLQRIHIEEDAGKNIHATASKESFMDLNRAGTALLEMVSHPDISSSFEAKAYLKTLRTTVQYLGICSGNMEEGAFRADTNISVRKKGATALGTKCELKNINSFKFIGDAIEYEIVRQIELIQEGNQVIQETRLWDTKEKVTRCMRSKVEAVDYRYFPEPDLPIVLITSKEIADIKSSMPELPTQKFERLVKTFNISDAEAEILIDDQGLANYYENAYNHCKSKQLINWVLRDVLGYLKEHKLDISSLLVTPEKLALLISLVEKGEINNPVAKELFIEVAKTGAQPEQIIKEKNLGQLNSFELLETIVQEVIAENQSNVAQYKAGNERIFPFFIGQAMKKAQGKANPQLLQELIKKHLDKVK